MDEMTYDFKSARKVFSRIGIAFVTILLVTTVLQLLIFAGGEDNWMNTSTWGMWIGSFLPIYAVAIPLGILIMRKLPACAPEDMKLGAKNFLVFVPMSLCVMYAGNIIGTILSLVLSGGTAENAVANYAMDNNPLKVLVMVVLAPVLEEYICRKQLIDRTRQYGEKVAVFLSALVFGLLHQNLYQFFYAFGLGLIFAYVYTRTGRLRYTILLHGFINFLGSVVAPWIMSNVDIAALESLDLTLPEEELAAILGPMLPGFVAYMAYAMLLIGFAIWGLVLLILKGRKLLWKPAQLQIPQGKVFKTAYLNAGMIVYVIVCLAFFVLALM